MSDVHAVTDEHLLQLARDARFDGYAPYSEYQVGAALLTGTGETIVGCNVEVSGRSTSIHAEMLAMYKAVELGHTEFECLAVSLPDRSGAAPCGLCQHSLAEFVEDLRIIEWGPDDEIVEYQLDELLGPAYRPSTRDR